MFLDLNIGHITGTAKVKNVFPAEVEWRERRSVGQMFFAPYESRQEFLYVAGRTVVSAATIGTAILYPIATGVAFGIYAGFIASYGILAGITKLFNCNQISSHCSTLFFDTLKAIVNGILQIVIDSVLLPVTVLMILTRSVSTGLHAVGICKGTNAAKEQPAEPSKSVVDTESETALLTPPEQHTAPAPMV